MDKVNLLRDWVKLNKEIMFMSEEEIDALLQQELESKARLRVLMRLYNRFSKLRGAREKVTLAQNSKA